jgi:hypothetical protein
MRFLIDIFKNAPKGDAFRMSEPPVKYADKISQLNSIGSDQYRKLDAATLNKVAKTQAQLVASTSGNNAVPGVKA